MKAFIFFFLFLSICADAQNPYVIHYTINDGLPTNNIYSSFQDKEGYMWFTTDVGLVKYNSKTFQLFNTDDGLSDNEIFQIKEDYMGRKWLLTLNGSPSFIYKGKIYNELNSELIAQIKNNSLLINYYEDSKNNIYLISRDGTITRINNKNEVKKLFLNKKQVIRPRVFGVWENNEKPFVLATKGIYNLDSGKLITPLDKAIPFRAFYEKGKVFFGNMNILNEITTENKIKKIIALPEKTEIINLFMETDSKMWFCTRKGLYFFENGIQKNYYFSENVVSGITKDNDGNYWVTTLNDGIYFVPSFDIYQKRIKINTISVKSASEIWFGGSQNNFYIKKGKYFSKNVLDNFWRKDDVRNIRFFKNDTYVIGKVGVVKISQEKKEKIRYGINDLLVVNDTTFIATSYTAKLYHGDLNKIDVKTLIDHSILDRRTNVLTSDSEKKVWIGTNFGLYTYDSKSKVSFLGKKNSALSTSIKDLYYDKENGLMLAASASKGLIILKGEQVKQIISSKNGLNNNTINTIEKMSTNTYLVGSNMGFNQISLSDDFSTFEIKNHNPYFGFENKIINDIAYTNDTVYIATNDELVYFNHKYLEKKSARPICIINNIYANGILLEKDIVNQIDYNDNDVKIEFTGMSYLDKGNVTFHYRLNKNEWSKTKETVINYKSLSPNDYTFSLYGVNGFGKKSTVKNISFIIQKPFWWRWWFITSSVFIIIALFFMLIKSRLNYVKKQFEKERKSLVLEKENIALENQMLALEQKSLRLQMNPHFIFNALNTIKGYYSEGNVQEASNYISKFSKLLRLLLENVEQYIPLSLEIEMLDLYLQLTQVRHQYKFDYQIVVSRELHKEDVNIPTLLMQPLIENAIIHGVAPKKQQGKILVDFRIMKNKLICSVKDNGIGRKASQKNRKIQHTSKALEITKERLKLIENQEKTTCSLDFIDLVEKNRPVGTKVIITIPILKIW